MSFTFDTKSNGSGSGDPVTVAHTCSANTKVLIVFVMVDAASIRAGSVPTYNSVAMTDSGQGTVDAFAKAYLEIFYLIDPSTGSSYNVSVPNTNSDPLYIAVASFEATGSVSRHASNEGEDDNANPTINVSTTIDNGLMLGGLIHDLNDSSSFVVGANYTEIYTASLPNSSYSAEYDLAWGSSGSIAVNWTADADDWGIIGLAFEEAAGGTEYQQSAAGTLTTAGVYSLLVSLSYAGALTSAGALLKLTALSYVGSLSSSGIVSTIKLFLQSLTGVLSSSGILVGQGQKALVGALSSTSTLAKTTILNYAGTLTSSGTISAIKTFLQALAGTLTSSSVLSKLSAKQLLGSLSSSGIVAKATILSYAGTLISAGALSAVKTFLQSLASTLTSAGILSNLPLKQLVGSLTSAGTLAKATAVSYAGILSSAGTVLKETILSYTGALTSSGILSSIKNAVVETIDLTLNSRSISFTLNVRATAMTLLQRVIDFTVGTRE